MSTPVQQGAAVLDQYDPDWWRHVDPARINLQCNVSCVLGQIAEGKGLPTPDGIAPFVATVRDIEATTGLHVWPLGHYGFNPSDADERSEAAEWGAEIDARLKQAGALAEAREASW